MDPKEKKLILESQKVIQELDKAIFDLHELLMRINRAVQDRSLDIQKHIYQKSIWNDIGMYCLRHGLPQLAEVVYSEMINALKRYEESREVTVHKGLAYHNLAISLYSQCRREEARIMFEKAYEEDQRTYGSDQAEEGLAREALRKLFSTLPNVV